jgi:ferritin
MIFDKQIDRIATFLLKKFKLDKILKYVEEENELDIKLKQVQKTLNKYGKYIEEIEKDIAILKKTKDKINKLKEIF